MLDVWSSSFTFIATIIGIGLFFDKIFINEETKEKIKYFIQSKDVDYTGPIYKIYLDLTVDAVFKKYLNHKLISSEYFKKCCIISMLSLMVVLLLQVYAHGFSLPEKFNLSSHQVYIILVFILVNVVIDYLSIAQTHAFFMIAKQQKTIGRVILLIVSDFILTINLFILLYSLFVSLLVMYENSHSMNYTAKYTVQTFDFKNNGNNQWPVEAIKEKSFTSWFDLQEPEVTLDKGWAPIIVHSNTDEISIVDVYKLYSKFIKMDVNPGKHYFSYETLTNEDGATKNNIKEYKINEKAEGLRYIIEQKKDNHKFYYKENLDEDYVPSYIDHQEIQVQLHSFSINNDLNIAHGYSFSEVDQLEDAFPVSMLQGISFISIGKINQEYITGLSRGNIVYGCLVTNEKYKLIWETSYSANLFNKKCRKKVSLVTANFHNEIAKIFNKKLKLNELYVPLNTFFLTSLVITFSVYIFLLFLISAKMIELVIFKNMKQYEEIFLKSPFAIVGLVMGFIYILIETLFLI